MSAAEKLKCNVFYVLAGTLFASAVSNAALVTTYIKLTGFQVTFTAFWMITLLCACFYSRKTFAISSGAALLCMIAVIAYLWHMDFDVPWFLELSDTVRELAGHIQGLTPYKEEYRVLGYGVVFAFSWFAAVFIRTGAGFYLLSALGFAVVGIISFTGYPLHGIHANSVLLVSGCLLMLKLTRSASRREDEDGYYYALNSNGLLLIPLCFCVLIGAAIVPQPEAESGTNIRQNVAGNIYRLNEFVLDRFGPKYFTFSSTGFSPSGGRLGGNILPNDRAVMNVYLHTNSSFRPYLAGAYRDTYTGDRWITAERVKIPTQTFSIATPASSALTLRHRLPDLGVDIILGEQLSGLEGEELAKATIDLFVQQSGLRTGSIIVMPARPTTTVFSPPNKQIFSHSASAAGQQGHTSGKTGEVYIDATGSVSTQKAMERGTSYTVEYVEGIFLPSAGASYLNAIDAVFSRDDSLYTDERVAQYLTLPENLPQRVIDLAEYITANARNPYEKMKALEEYLVQYTYTLTPGDVPAGADFVDWFLFESREGYCTYYATALAVMGRAVGVPTRYAEGFTLPSKPDGNGIFAITNGQAHAWVDALFPALGWVTFEATAPYNYPFYNGGELPSLPSSESERPAEDEEELEDFLADFERESTSPRPTGQSDDDEDESALSSGIRTAALITLAAATICLAGGLRYYIYKRRLEKLESLPPREGAVEYFGRIAGVLASNGIALEPQETALVYARRVDSANGLGADGFTMEQMAAIFSRASYSKHEVTEHELGVMSRCYNVLTSRPGAPAMERFAAWIERYILGKY